MLKKNKICIGTANFDQTYGIYNTNKIKKKDIKSLLLYCKKNNINNFDTAPRYNNSELILGKFLNYFHNPLVSTKLPKIENNLHNIEKWLNINVEKSLKKLNLNNINVLYIADNSNFNNKNISFLKDLYNAVIKLKKNNLINNIGFSVYDLNIINNQKFIFPDVLQIPFNIFDQNILKKKYLNKLKKNKIKIYIRSIFLQGVLLTRDIEKITNLSLRKKIEDLNKFRKNLSINNLEFNLNFINKFDFYDKVLIGINSKEQLDDIINFKKIKNFDINYKKYNCEKRTIIDPRLWTK